jgi:hypothetical protein
VSAAKVKLVYSGPADVVNLDVALETGNGRLEPGREISVSAEFAELLQRSTPYWDTAGAKPKPKAKGSTKAKSSTKKKAAAAPAEATVEPAADTEIDAGDAGSQKEDES